MSPVLHSDYNILSNFTWSYFEDSGWYKVNYTYTNALTQYELLWGKDLGCDFVLQSCDNPITYPYHCNHINITHQCTFDGISKGTCKQSPFMDGCYTVLPDSNGACIDVDNAESSDAKYNITEAYGAQARCYEHSDECNSTVSFSCLATQLVQHSASGLLAYYINTDGMQVWCREGERAYVNERLITCPSTKFILLRTDPSAITTVDDIPPPLCHKSCASCAEINDATQCLSCPGDASLLGTSPNNCSSISETNITITAADCSCTEGDIRLMNGSTQYEGRVEICLNEEWGVVCDDGFDDNDAKVACRQLGFDPTVARAVCCSNFGSGYPLPMTIDYLYCTGNENAISECSHNGVGVSSCSIYEAAGIRCGAPCLSDSQVDLIVLHGTPSNITSGIVRVCSNGSGGLVCDSGWDHADARVACKAAGYSPYGAVAVPNQYLSSSSSYPPIMNNLGCSGNESYLSECTSFSPSCSVYDYAGATCQDVEFVPDNCTHGDIRFVGGLKKYEGRVEVCINDVWGTVCDVSWSSADANVACRQAGFQVSGAIARYNAYHGQGTGPVLLSGLTCFGSESSLLSCTHSLLSASCGHHNDAGVTCGKPCDGSVELLSYFGDPILVYPASGIVSVCDGSTEFLVCDDGWDFAAAKVACRSAGFSPYGAVPLLDLYNFYFPYYSTIGSVVCNGSESTLTDCSYSPFSFCFFFDYAGAYCQAPNTASDGCTHGAVRLSNGSKENEGRVEICINEVWGTICDSGWSVADANVVCRQAGFLNSGAVAHTNAYFGEGTVPILLSNIYCSGSESALLNCSFSTSLYCDHGDDAGVTCLEPCVDDTVELLEPNGLVSSRGYGVVSVCVNQTRTVLCDYSWDSLDAKVVCQQLGFSEYGAVALKSQYLPGYPLGHFNASLCEGDEGELMECFGESYAPPYYCYYSTLAGVICQEYVSVPDNCSEGTVRLVGGTLPHEGDIQVCHNNLWGAICDIGWTIYDAQVICKQLGYLSFGALPTAGSYYGTSDMPVYYSNVGCSSSDASIDQCYSSFTSTCGSANYAGVVCGGSCAEDEVGLFSGTALYTSSSGIVQTCVLGTRGVICDYNWDHIDAKVVCQQLGFSPYGALASTDQYLSSTYSCTLPSLLTNVNCNGEEKTLSECPFEYGSCSNYYYSKAGVVCQNSTFEPDECTHGEIKLVGGNGDHEGTVHVCINQVWSTICDFGWSSADAGVVCQQLGYQRGGAQYLSNSFFGRGSGPVFLTSIGCSSSHSNLFDCSYSLVPPTSYCNDHNNDVGVICEAPCEGEGFVDLVISSGTLSSTASGLIHVCVNGNKGTVCDYGWGFADAIVACRAAGYSPYGAVPLDGLHLKFSSSYSMSYVDCIGNETVLTDCPYSTTSYCSYFNYAGVGCQSDIVVPDKCTHGKVRLVGSTEPWQGRVEVCINNLWASICDSSWSPYDAQTVCSQLGYSRTGAQALSNSYFGDGHAPTLITSVGCSSYSTNLLDCYFSATSTCPPGNTAGVICDVPCSETKASIKFIQSSGTSGVVQLCDSSTNTSYLICDYGWDFVDASVACDSLGLSPYGAIPLSDQYVSSSTISQNSILSYVSCYGTESTLSNCDSVPLNTSCYSYNFAGVRCQAIDTIANNCTHGAVRLVGGSNQYEGNVEVCVNGLWGTICDSGWSTSDAQVACGDAGYPGSGVSTRINSYFGIDSSRPMLLSYLSCSSSSSSLVDCSFSEPSSFCDEYDIAGVVCEGPCTDGSVRLLEYSGGLNTTSGGIVQLCFDSKKFLVCDNGWDFADARVVCQSVGYSPYGAVAIHDQALSSNAYNGLGLLSQVSCNGTETNFTDCEHDVLYSGYCNYNFAAVYCQEASVPDNCVHGDVRLTGGRSKYEGTVEICVNNLWGTVCDSSWSTNDAAVVCSQLGYLATGAIPQYNAWFGFGSGPIVMSGLQCGGYESSLTECTSSIPSSFCDHFDDAGVTCQAPTFASVDLMQSSGSVPTSTSGTVMVEFPSYTAGSSRVVPGTLAPISTSEMSAESKESPISKLSTASKTPLASKMPPVSKMPSGSKMSPVPKMSPASSCVPEAIPEAGRSYATVFASILVVMIILLAVSVTFNVIAILAIRKMMKKQEDSHCFHLCCSAHSHGTEEIALCEDQDTKSDMEVSTDVTVPEKQDISNM